MKLFNIGDRLQIVETISGTYFYHLSETGENGAPAICGYRQVMHSNSPLSSWNMEPTHIRYKFCTDCHRIAMARGFNLPVATENTITFNKGT